MVSSVAVAWTFLKRFTSGAGGGVVENKDRERRVSVYEEAPGFRLGPRIENKDSTDVGSPPPTPPVCMSTHPEGKSC